MSFTKLGGAIFAVGLVVIPVWAVVHYIVIPIFCGISAGCGSAAW